jgi:hypothetical protein
VLFRASGVTWGGKKKINYVHQWNASDGSELVSTTDAQKSYLLEAPQVHDYIWGQKSNPGYPRKSAKNYLTGSTPARQIHGIEKVFYFL